MKLNELKCEKKSMPEFAELIDAFNEQLSHMDENSNTIYEKVKMIKDFCGSTKEEPITEKGNQGGILGVLWVCVNRMEKYNIMLDESKENLVRFIG